MKMRKHLPWSTAAGCLLIVGLTLHRTVPAHSQRVDSRAGESRIHVLMNGAPLRFAGQPPVMKDGRVLVPLRGVFEALGATVEWNPDNQSVTARRGSTLVRLAVDSANATVNGKRVALDVPAQMMSGHVLVPLRFVSEAMGADVGWREAEQTVTIKMHRDVVVNPPAGGGDANQPDGQAIFVQSCGNCHRIGDLGRGRIALNHIGAEHDVAWMEVQIRSPEQHNSQMPAFPPSRLSDRNLRILSRYLAGLK